LTGRGIKNEVLKRDLSNISTDKLIKVLVSLDNMICELLPAKTFGGEDIQEWTFFKPAFNFDPKE